MKTHPFIKFPPSLKQLDTRVWLQLGEIQARIEYLLRLPVPPEGSGELRQVYLAKGVHGTTAIEGNSFSEEEVAKIINKELQAPPSRAYQEQQIDNMVNAFNTVYDEMVEGESTRFSVELLHNFHKLVLEDLEETLSTEVVIGEFRHHRVVAGRYLAAPPEECATLMREYCDWLNEEPEGSRDYVVAEQIVKAIVAHVYFAWIHPYGDGNGRMARLLEFAVLLKAGVPDIAAHLLSNFYNDTRDQYYRELQESHGEYRDGAYPPDGNLYGFLAYALQGFKDELDKQFLTIHALQVKSIWHDLIHVEFRRMFSENLSTARQRQKRLALDLTDRRLGQPVKKAEIPEVSHALTRAYMDKTGRTIQRDLNELVRLKLLKRVDKGYEPNTDILMAFFARARDNDQ